MDRSERSEVRTLVSQAWSVLNFECSERPSKLTGSSFILKMDALIRSGRTYSNLKKKYNEVYFDVNKFEQQMLRYN